MRVEEIILVLLYFCITDSHGMLKIDEDLEALGFLDVQVSETTVPTNSTQEEIPRVTTERRNSSIHKIFHQQDDSTRIMKGQLTQRRTRDRRMLETDEGTPPGPEFPQQLHLPKINVRPENREIHTAAETSLQLKAFEFICENIAQSYEEILRTTQPKNSRTIRKIDPQDTTLQHSLLLALKNRRVNDVLEEIKINHNCGDLNPRFKFIKQYATGEALVVCESETDANNLRQIIMKSTSLQIVPMKHLPYEFQIPNLAEDITESEILLSISTNFHEQVSRVYFQRTLDHHGKNLKVAVIQARNSLREKIEACPMIKIRASYYKIDTTVKVPRCASCHLLGHTTSQCSQAPRRLFPSQDEPCIDCCYVSTSVAATQIRPLLDVHHRTDSDECPTKNFYKKQWEMYQGRAQNAQHYERDEIRPTKKDGEVAAEMIPPRIDTNIASTFNEIVDHRRPQKNLIHNVGAEQKMPVVVPSSSKHPLIDPGVLVQSKLHNPAIDVQSELTRIRSAMRPPVNTKFVRVYKSGVVLVLCYTKDDADRLRKAVTESETLDIGETRMHFRKITIRGVPLAITESDITDALYLKYNERPHSVKFVVHPGSRWKLAMVRVGPSLLGMIELAPTIALRGHHFKMEISAPTIPRCTRCQLLGHMKETCSRMPRPIVSPHEPCVDCSNRMHYIGRRIDVNHPTGDERCPTKTYRERNWRRRELLASEKQHDSHVGGTYQPGRDNLLEESTLRGDSASPIAGDHSPEERTTEPNDLPLEENEGRNGRK